MSEKPRDDISVMSDIPAYAKREKNYKKPPLSDVNTVEIRFESDSPDRSETVRFSPEPVIKPADYETQSYSRKGAFFSGKRTAVKRNEGKLIEERIIGGEFIDSLSVYEWGGDFGFYEKFRSDAEKYRNLKGSPCPNVHFFSYVPQYSQMRPDQFDYYLYLREEIRSGRYPIADLSYVLLLIYEIINLGDVSDNKRDLSVLCGLWSAYRTVYPVVDKYLSEWVPDYCLIHSVLLPEFVFSFLPQITARSTIKEFYLEEAFKRSVDDLSAFSECLLISGSDYVPEKSRYLTDAPELLKKLKSIFTEAIGKMIERGIGLFSPDLKTASVIRRDAYSGSLCSYSIKKRLAVNVSSQFRSQEVRRELTEILRYCENTVRKNEGIRSRLTVDLPFEIKELIDNGTASRPESEAYLSQYDAPAGTLSIEGAIDLENLSWDSTERLIGDSFDEESCDDFQGALSYDPDVNEPVPEDTRDDLTDSTVSKFFDLLSKLINNRNVSFEQLCRESGLFPDSAAAEINEQFSDQIGDIILENSNGYYQLIEDYIEDIEEIIRDKGEKYAAG